MAFSVNTNITSLQAQDYLRTTSDFQAKTINRVTSGLRIISSGDDAAGLAIANGFRSDQAVLSQGVRNANDGLSTLQTIDGGMSNISKLLDRARTLATQSASDTFTGNRSLLNDEFQSVLTEINRQSQAIGLNSGGTFARSLSVFIGGGRDSNGIAANTNGSISVDLSNSTVDARSLGLSGVRVSSKSGTDIGAGSATTNVTSILANATNKGSESSPDVATFYLKGPGFDSAGVQISVNTKNIGGTSDLAAAVNSALQAAGNGGTQSGTALKNANITATIVKDSTGKEQLSFSSPVAAFQVQAGDRMANALLGNFEATNAVLSGSDTHATVDTNGAAGNHTLNLTIDGTAVTVTSFTQAAGRTKAQIVSDLNADAGFAAKATASLKGNQVLLTSKNSGASSSVAVATSSLLSDQLGLTGTATVGSASTGASLGTTVVGASNTAAAATQFTAANSGVVTFRFSGAGLTSPVDVAVTTFEGETLQAAVNDLSSQVTSNSSLKGAGIAIGTPNLDGSHQLLFNATNGQAFHVDVTGDVQNQFGFGSFVSGNNASGNNGDFDYTTLTGATYDPGTAAAQGSTAGTATLEFSINGQASNTNSIAVDLSTLPGAAAATVVGATTVADPITINAPGAVAAKTTFGSQVAATLAFDAGASGLVFTADTAGAGGNAVTVRYVNGGASQSLSVSVSGNDITVNLATDGSSVITSTANAVKAALDGSTAAAALINTALAGAGTGLVTAHAATNLANGGDAGLTFTAVAPGTDGNNIDVTFTHSASSSLGVVTTGNHVVVTLAATAGSVITSTAAQVMAALNGDATTAALIRTEATGATTALVSDQAATALTGGAAATDDVNNELNLTISGHAYNIKLDAGSAVTLNDIADQINTYSDFSTYGKASVKDNVVVLESVLKGAGASVQVEAGSANDVLGLSETTKYGTSPTGTDIRDYLNRQFAANEVLQQAGLQASFSGNRLTIASSNGTHFRINEIATTAATAAAVVGSKSFTTEATSAVVQGGSGANFNFSAASTLSFTVGGVAKTVNFGIRNYTKQEVLDTINSQVTGATASVDTGSGKIQIVSDALGAAATIVIGNNDASTANSVLGFAAGASVKGVAATGGLDVTGSNDYISLNVDGEGPVDVQLTHGTAALGTARTAINVRDDLNTYFTAHEIGASASVDATGHLKIASTSTGVNSSIEVLTHANSANSFLGLTVGITEGTDTNIGFGATGATFKGNVSSGAAATSAQIDASGASETIALAFTPLLYGSDAQTITVAATSAAGAPETLSMVLHNDETSRSGRSIDEAISYINSQLQQSNSATLKQVLAVKDNDAGVEKIRFMSTLGSFQISLGSNANTTGVGSDSPGAGTVPPEQGTTVASTVSEGGSMADISNQSAASAAVNALSTAVSMLGKAQAAVGKGQNNMNYAVNLAQSQLSNLAAAESRIRDADLASESANLTKAQILLQAGVAALAQANSAPQQILSLLRG